MTAKDKAEIIVSDYEKYLPDGNYDTKQLAKKMAFMAVNMVQSSFVSATYIDYKEQVDEVDWTCCYSYWQDVKVEIQQL